MAATIERTTAKTIAPSGETTRQRATRYVLAGIRLALGWIFLWAFLDKMFGLGHETEAKNAWIDGGSPTKGFLPSAPPARSRASTPRSPAPAWADWLFMVGLAAIGVALMLGIGMRIAAVAGGLLLVMMWTAVLPPENNPFMDDHLIYAAVLVGPRPARRGRHPRPRPGLGSGCPSSSGSPGW